MANITLKRVRLAFPQLWVPKAVGDSKKPRYSAVFIIEPGSEASKQCEAAMLEAASSKWPGKGPTVLKALAAAGRTAYKKEPRTNKNGEVYVGFEGMHSLNAANQVRPTIVDRNRAPLTEEDGRPYGGCYVNALVSFWAQDNPDPTIGRRINCSLMGVQFVADGEAFGQQRVARVDDFEEVPAEDGDVL